MAAQASKKMLLGASGSQRVRKSFPARILASVVAFVTPAARDRCEGLSRVGEDNGCARCCLIAPDDDVDVEWIELDTAAHPPGILGSHKCRPRAEEGVENNLATVREIDQRILQHCGRFHRRMILETFSGVRSK